MPPTVMGPGLPGKVPAPNLINGATTHGLLGRRRIRHPGEIPLLVIGIVFTVLVYLGWWFALILTVINLARGSGPTIFSIDSDYLDLFMVLGALPLLLWVARAFMYGRMRANGVKMSLTQFPEGYRMVVEAAEDFGLRRVPDAYVISGGGTVNAFAVGHGFRRFVTVHSDLFEVGGTARDPEALRFVIAHEVGHLAAGHVGYFRLLFTQLFRVIPFVGDAFSRSQEYTADNYGYAHCPQGAPGVMALLSGGKYLNAHVNVHELADRAASEKGFWVHVVNWRSSHPVITWRTHALRDRNRPGRLFFRPRTQGYESPLPSGHDFTEYWPSPQEVRDLLDRTRGLRNPQLEPQFGRYPGVDYSDGPRTIDIQVAHPFTRRDIASTSGMGYSYSASTPHGHNGPGYGHNGSGYAHNAPRHGHDSGTGYGHTAGQDQSHVTGQPHNPGPGPDRGQAQDQGRHQDPDQGQGQG
ncbi:M48 family metallopeptidase [Devriesea agamarum]|uniref:M48 family metallopeptidase n=1 Tax=Devriesea agamarum TaxID=472569 RepID=UPI000A02ABF9|nr:M48 family metallopeptidase [Devriesea agamarum]